MFGGIVVPLTELSRFRKMWRAHAAELDLVQTGSKPRSAGDVKAVDFSTHYAWESYQVEYRNHPALAVFSLIVKEFRILPLVIVIDKDEAGDEILAETKKGDQAVDQAGLSRVLLMMFGAFLSRKRGRGRVCMDRLRSPKEESDFRSRWNAEVKDYKRVDAGLEFVDSCECPEVQAADVLLGLLRAQHEQNWPMPQGIVDFLNRGQAEYLPVFHLS